jgi:hypothetical protein
MVGQARVGARPIPSDLDYAWWAAADVAVVGVDGARLV